MVTEEDQNRNGSGWHSRTLGRAGSYQFTRDYVTGWSTLDSRYPRNKKGMDRRDPRLRLDFGSPFFSRKVTCRLGEHVEARYKRGSLTYEKDGLVFASLEGYNEAKRLADRKPRVLDYHGDSSCPTVPELNASGAAGIASCLPSLPPSSLATTIGELREGLPKVIGATFLNDRSFSSTGDEFLNFQFGILPTIHDIQSTAASAGSYGSYLAQWRRNRGHTVRRRRNLGTVSSTDSVSLSSRNPYNDNGYPTMWMQGSRTKQTISSTRLWLSCSFHIAPPPMGEGQFESIRRFTRDFGLVPDVMTVWNLSAWSWLFDWFVNFDDFLTNAAYLGPRGVNLHYAYLMAETVHTEQFLWSGRYVTDGSSAAGSVPTYSDLSIRDEFKTVTKMRVKASPFGFGVVYDDLTAKQKAILTALGLSRMSF